MTMVARWVTQSGRLLAKARASARTGRHAAAAEHYAAYLERNPHATRIWIQYGHSLKEAGDALAAGRAYRQAITLSPHDADAYRHLGHLTKRTGDAQAALGLFLRGLAIDPRAGDLAEDAVDCGLPRDALAARRTAAAMEVGAASANELRHSGEILRQIRVALALKQARQAARRRAWAKAARRYRRLLALDPNQPAAHVQLGNMMKESGRLPDARQAYLRAIAWAPHSPIAHAALGHCCNLLDDRAGAELAFLTTLRLKPDDEDARAELTARGWDRTRLDAIAHHAWAVPPRAATTTAATATATATDAAAAPDKPAEPEMVVRIEERIVTVPAPVDRPVMPPGLRRREQAIWSHLRTVVAGH